MLVESGGSMIWYALNLLMRRNLFVAFIELHVLYHASEAPVYGLWMISELAAHGYRVSPGTLYPILHSLETAGFLKSRRQVNNGKVRKYYSITRSGKSRLKKAKQQLGELVREVFDDDDFKSLTALRASSKRR